VAFFDGTPADWGVLKKRLEVADDKLLRDGDFALVAGDDSRLLTRLFESNEYARLADACVTFQGIVTGSDRVFVVDPSETGHLSKAERSFLRPFVFGQDIDRYLPVAAKHLLLYIRRTDSLHGMPAIEARLRQDREKLGRRRETQRGVLPWWALHWARDPRVFEPPKILVQGIRNLTLPRRVVATLDTDATFAGVNLTIIRAKSGDAQDLKAVLGVLNSKLVNCVFRLRFVDHRIKNQYLDALPIPRIVLDGSRGPKGTAGLVAHVDRILALHTKLAAARTDHEKTVVQRQIDATDREIDRLVYELYGLTDEEIKIVEHANDPSG
jgi:hypothetical protein